MLIEYGFIRMKCGNIWICLKKMTSHPLISDPKNMMTFKQFAGKLETIPASTSWYLADLGEARGRQELYARQAPQKLKILREHALIESTVY